MPEPLRVEVVWATREAQETVCLELPPGSTLRLAIERSGLLRRHPEVTLGVNAVGVHGRRRHLDELLRDGDRVEIYRPVVADPKVARRRRAEAQSPPPR